VIDLSTPVALADAIDQLSAKTPVGSILRSAEWARVPLALRQRAQFSAGVESVRFMANVQEKLLAAVSLERERVKNGEAFVDRSSFIGDMRKLALELGIGPTDRADIGTLKDITHSSRLGMIFDIQTGQARGYANWKMDQDPDVLDAFPAQELLRVEDRKVPRQWHERWADAGGNVFGGRMIALKTDDIWTRISRFGVPWPPFDFNSGMGVEDVSRDEAEALGVIRADTELHPLVQDFNDDLEASVTGLTDAETGALEKIFGDQIRIEGDTVQWRGTLIQDLYQSAMEDKNFKAAVNLGVATGKTVAKAAEAGVDLAGYELQLRADDIRHAMKQHGSEKERERGQVPLTSIDFEVLPEVWRDPDSVKEGNKPDTLEFEKEVIGMLYMVEWQRVPTKRRAQVITVYRR